MTGIFHWFG